MTKTFAKIAARHDVKSGEPGMMPLAAVNAPPAERKASGSPLEGGKTSDAMI